MIKLSSFSLQTFLVRKIPLRTYCVSTNVPIEDEKKDMVQKTLDEKLRITNSIKDKFVNLSVHWKDKHELYYGKNRDLVNFPMPIMAEYHPKVRMAFFPDEWFNALYLKTGVTGPYLFLWGGLLFVLQKELWVMEHTFNEIVPSVCAAITVIKILGPIVNKYHKKIVDKKSWYVSEYIPSTYKSKANKVIEIAKEDKKCSDVNIDLFRASKENVALQLEAIYRNRALDLYKSVKNRLDYQVDKQLSKQRFQRLYMINWIVDSVIKDFSPQQEKVILTQCISDLKNLAKTQKSI